MSEVRIVLRDGNQEIHSTWHGSCADAAIAALSAEPETIEELEAAMERFQAPSQPGLFQGFAPGIDDEPYDAGVVIIDLAARLVVCDSTYSSPDRQGCLLYDDGQQATDVWLRYQLADDWQFSGRLDGWRRIAEERRRERAAAPRCDARDVLYGRPMLTFIAEECWRAFAEQETSAVPAEEDQAKPVGDNSVENGSDEDSVRQIHARWLTTVRDELSGETPRDHLLAKRDVLDADLQHRADQWARLDKCPRGLDPASHAFRFAGFATHEIVIYYELLRHLVWSCRDQSGAFAGKVEANKLTAGDFLTTEVPRLAMVRDEWWNAADPEYHGLSPRAVVDHERARLPEGISGHEAIIDHDCPLCEMQAELPGPVFWHLDGCNMDADFAFSFHRTYAEWEMEQREYEEFNRKFDEREAERRRSGADALDWPDSEGVWGSSYVDPDVSGRSPVLSLYAIGARLVELIEDLKQPVEERLLIDRLRRDFGNLRAICDPDDVLAAASLLEPVLQTFCETLDAVSEARAALQPKCADLEQQLRRFVESSRRLS